LSRGRSQQGSPVLQAELASNLSKIANGGRIQRIRCLWLRRTRLNWFHKKDVVPQAQESKYILQYSPRRAPLMGVSRHHAADQDPPAWAHSGNKLVRYRHRLHKSL